jgi:hypothetical protein
MKNPDLDRILSKEEEILPSSGFAASVMEAVHREAAVPPPIPFPWKRALPGLCVVALTLVSLITASILLLIHGAPGQSIPRQWLTASASIIAASRNMGVAWILVALLLSFASVQLAMHFAANRISGYQRI